MNFDNQGIVSGTFLRQRWVLLLVDGSIYFTETFCKLHFIAIEYTTSPEKYWNFTKLNAWEDQEVWSLVGKATKCLDQMGILLIEDGYFYIGWVIIITVFPWQVLVITQSYRYKLNIKLFCCKNDRSNLWRRSVKNAFLNTSPATLLKRDFNTGAFLWNLRNF